LLTDAHLNFTDVLAVLVIFQYLVIGGFLLLYRPARRSGSHILALFFFLVAINLLDGMLMIDGFYLMHPALALFEDSFVLTYGPLLFFYARRILTPTYRWQRSDLVHLVPFALLFFATMIFYHGQGTDRQIQIIESIMSQNLPLLIGVVSSGMLLLHFIVYVAICIYRIEAFHRSLHRSHASLAHVNLNWLLYTYIIVIVTFIISFAATLLSMNGHQLASRITLIGVLLVLLYYINSFVLNAIRRPRLFIHTDVAPEPKTRLDSMADAEKQEIKEKLDRLLTMKFYRKHDINIEVLSNMTGVPPRKMSEYLNDVVGQSFFDFVNNLRIADAQAMLSNEEGKNLTIQQIMYEVGFNSKSSFNTIFKQKTGKTPSEFRKRPA
jgi:AraC-like DNA-binding protein